MEKCEHLKYYINRSDRTIRCKRCHAKLGIAQSPIINTEYIEILMARKFNPRQNLVIPNVSWGFGIHECDLLVASKAGYLTEIEIKISASDLKKDSEKFHNHTDERIKEFYFAIPSKLAKYIEYIPIRAGVFVINSFGRVFKIKNAVKNKNAKPISYEEKSELYRLGALRIFGLKEKNYLLKNNIECL